MARAWILAALLLADVTPRGELFRAASARHLGTLQVSTLAVSSIAFSRDGRRVVALDVNGTLSVWDLSGRRRLRTHPGAFYNRGRIDLSPDGSVVAGLSPNRQSVRLLDVDRGTEIRALPEIFPHPSGFALGPDGKRMAALKRDQGLRIIDVATGSETRTLVEAGTGQAGFPVWSPDGKYIACNGWDGQVRIFETARGEVVGTFAGLHPQAAFLGFTPDGSCLVHVAQDFKVRTFDRSGRQLLEFAEAFVGPPLVAISRDGSMIAGVEAKGTGRIWETKSGRRLREFDAGPATQATFTPDGRYLAIAGSDGTVKLWGGGGAAAAWPKPVAPRAGNPGYLGITGDTIEGAEAGVQIASIYPGTPAEKAGLQVGDVIIMIGATSTDTFETLRGTVMEMREGDEIEVTYRRNGASNKVKVKLAARPPESP